MPDGFKTLFVAVLITIGATGVATAEPAGKKEVPTVTTTPFAVVYQPGPRWRPGVAMRDQGLRDHFYYVQRLNKGGQIVLAGQLGPDGGLIVLNARDQSEADSIVAADPAVTAGLFSGTARPFTPRFVGARSLAPVAP